MSGGPTRRDVVVAVPSQGNVVQWRVFLPADRGAVDIGALDVRSAAVKAGQR